jgi:hypothetical protein
MMTGSELVDGALNVKREYVNYIGRVVGGARRNKNLLHNVKPPELLSLDKTTVLKFRKSL